MKKLSDFQDSKVDLEHVQGGKCPGPKQVKWSGQLIWYAPGGASTPGNFQTGSHLDVV